ncbi:MAG: hypothetical protein BWK73_41765 [Thiothrix lacustris]|jgi:polyhydroxyalkanoate synthesis regulator phasin|uniref:Terminase n=1 Tax=Thiothrix lacustris TaxID=525917 RepID=A0A1Y1QCL3_9GAMM|nr:MAG: hypothetical protein BWK73_41765 [Thiothrix lacustris]
MGVILQSYAARHRQDVEAGRVAPRAHPSSQHPANYHKLMLVKLDKDKHDLRAIKSQFQRQVKKLAILFEYADYLTTVINSGDAKHNETLVTICLWALDTMQVDYFITLAEYALRHRMNSPQGFKRTLPELLMEEFSGYVLDYDKPSEMLDRLQHLGELTNKDKCAIADEITAKFYKAQGLALERSNPQAALQGYQLAQQYGARVKQAISRLEKQLCKPTNPTA